ncbi:MAG: hypothetical protein WA775_06895 [Psychroserpens sp.]|uniref:hypothetical protein n=1 Tax=Psychroserpens sp. TaxID=2020870 RepID=UPI003C71E4CB
MKILHCMLIMSLLFVSCDKDDDNSNTDDSPLTGTDFQATIDGGNFSNYDFDLGVYIITAGTANNTLSIDIGDSNGEQITLFLNATGGFDSGVVKEMNNVDSNDFITYALFRQQSPMNSYFSSEGSVTITENRAHPTESGVRLISGNFDITAISPEDSGVVEITGAFSELEYND